MYEEELKYMEKLISKSTIALERAKEKPNVNHSEVRNIQKKKRIQESIYQVLKGVAQ